MKTVLLSDPDERSRVMLAALIEALGHRVVYELGPGGCVDAAVIEPASHEAVRLVQRARTRHRVLPVVCVTGGRRNLSGKRLVPVAYLDKPVRVGPFVRAVASAVDLTRGEGAPALRVNRLVAA